MFEFSQDPETNLCACGVANVVCVLSAHFIFMDAGCGAAPSLPRLPLPSLATQTCLAFRIYFASPQDETSPIMYVMDQMLLLCV